MQNNPAVITFLDNLSLIIESRKKEGVSLKDLIHQLDYIPDLDTKFVTSLYNDSIKLKKSV